MPTPVPSYPIRISLIMYSCCLHFGLTFILRLVRVTRMWPCDKNSKALPDVRVFPAKPRVLIATVSAAPEYLDPFRRLQTTLLVSKSTSFEISFHREGTAEHHHHHVKRISVYLLCNILVRNCLFNLFLSQFFSVLPYSC